MLDIPDGSAKEQGIALGRAAAAAMLAARTDRMARPGTSLWPNRHAARPAGRPVGPNNANVFATTKNIDTFSIKRSDQFRTEGPPDMASAEYAAAFNEVKLRPARELALTDAQNRLASLRLGTGSAPSTERCARSRWPKGLSTADQAIAVRQDASIARGRRIHRLLGRQGPLAVLAAPDGYPVGRHRRHHPATVADPNWMALFPIPVSGPAVSGYNCFTAAVWHSAKAVLRGPTRSTFSVTQPRDLGFDPRAGYPRLHPVHRCRP